MITRTGVLALAATAALLVAGGCAVAGAVVASAATSRPPVDASADPVPSTHPLAEQPAPTPTMITAEVGAYMVQPRVPGRPLVTEDQLLTHWKRTFGTSTADAGIRRLAAWDEAAVRCMARHGLAYDPRTLSVPPDWQGSDAQTVLNGTGGEPGVPRFWQNLGCEGIAAHDTGYTTFYVEEPSAGPSPAPTPGG